MGKGVESQNQLPFTTLRFRIENFTSRVARKGAGSQDDTSHSFFKCSFISRLDAAGDRVRRVRFEKSQQIEEAALAQHRQHKGGERKIGLFQERRQRRPTPGT